MRRIGTQAKRIVWLATGVLVVIAAAIALMALRSDRHAPLWSHWHDAQISQAELADIAKDLQASEAWFNSLDDVYVHYTSTRVRSASDCRRQRDEAAAQFPDVEIAEDNCPHLKQTWNSRRWFARHGDRVAWEQDSDALGRAKAVWDGEKVVQITEHLTAQPTSCSYFPTMKGYGITVLGGLDEFPRPCTIPKWAADRNEPPSSAFGLDELSCIGELEYQGQPCLVLAGPPGNSTRWIVGRKDHRIYGKRHGRQTWVYADHREVAPGIVWPFHCTCSSYEGKGDDLQWQFTTETTVDTFAVAAALSDALFEVPRQRGVEVVDFRQEEDARYTYDPDRTQGEWQAIQDDIAKRASEKQAYDTRVAAIMGRKAPPLGNGRWLNSPPLTLAQLEGNRIMIGFTAVGCAPCENTLAQFASRMRAKETVHTPMLLVFLASDSEQSIRGKLAKFGLTCPVFIPEPASTDRRGACFQAYGVKGYPTVVTIDAYGNIDGHSVGPIGPLEE